MRLAETGTKSRGGGGREDVCGAWPGEKRAQAGEPELAQHTLLLQLAGEALVLLGSCGTDVTINLNKDTAKTVLTS